MSNIQKMRDMQREIDEMQEDNRKREGIKWYILLFASCITGVSLYFGIIPSFNLMFLHLKENIEL